MDYQLRKSPKLFKLTAKDDSFNVSANGKKVTKPSQPQLFPDLSCHVLCKPSKPLVDRNFYLKTLSRNRQWITFTDKLIVISSPNFVCFVDHYLTQIFSSKKCCTLRVGSENLRITSLVRCH